MVLRLRIINILVTLALIMFSFGVYHLLTPWVSPGISALVTTTILLLLAIATGRCWRK